MLNFQDYHTDRDKRYKTLFNQNVVLKCTFKMGRTDSQSSHKVTSDKWTLTGNLEIIIYEIKSSVIGDSGDQNERRSQGVVNCAELENY